MEQDKNSAENRVKGLKPFKPGESGNLNGRPNGQKNYKTLFREALINLAKLNDTTPSALELDLISKGFSEARKGNFNFYKDILDRLHGKPDQHTDITSGGEKLNTFDAKQLTKIAGRILDGDSTGAKESD